MPSNEEVKEFLITRTDDIKLVSDYTSINFNELLELDCYTFKSLLRDAFIDKMRKSKEGQEFLEDCWLLQQTMPDKNRLRQFN